MSSMRDCLQQMKSHAETTDLKWIKINEPSLEQTVEVYFNSIELVLPEQKKS